jgi:hypothetical protein
LGLLLVGNGGAASEDVGVALLKLGKNLEAVLGLREASREHFDGLKHFVLEGGISYDRDSLLKHIVAKLMSDKALDDEVHADGAGTRLIAELAHDDLVVPEVGALEDLVDLDTSLVGLQALLDNVRRELELAESHEVTSNEVEDLVIAQVALELEHILNQVVAIGIFNENVDAADNHVSEGQLLRLEALLEAALHNAAAVLV